MTNNPDKVEQLTSLGVEVVKRMPLIVGVNDENKEYLGTKASRMGHTISDDDLDGP
jgi:GTP cyclohydrolase II